MTDEELFTRAAAGDERAAATAIERFTPYAMTIARAYFVQGGDREDVRQEALIGVWKATRDWRPGLSTSARSFVHLCVVRQLITAVKTAGRGKHRALTHAAREFVDVTGERWPVESTIEAPNADPVDIIERRRHLEVVVDAVAKLSPRERRALDGYVNGLSYAEIDGRDDGVKAKWVDNALQRARRKIYVALEEAA